MGSNRLDHESGGEMTRLTFNAEWSGELAAGLRAGSEEVTIQFRDGQHLDADLVEYWQDAIAEFYNGAVVELIETETETEDG